jgi:excisionase family DNA binding protein
MGERNMLIPFGNNVAFTIASQRLRSRKLLSTAEMAQLIGVTSRTVRNWAETRRMPGMLIGGRWRFRRADIIRWMRDTAHE